MSQAYNDHIENLNAERERGYIASQLSIDPDALDDHPYTLDYGTTNDGGIVTSWLIYWEDTAPDGVSTNGDAGSLWTSIQPDGEDYEPENPDE